MADNDWSVGDTIWNGAVVFGADKAKVTTGTLELQYIAHDGTDTLYLDDALTAMTSTPNSIDVTYQAAVGAHAHLLTVPEAMRGLTGILVATDPVSGNEWRETWEVSGGVGDGKVLTIKDGTAP